MQLHYNKQNVKKVDETNIRASPVAVLPPALRSNRTHHEGRPRLKIKKSTEPFNKLETFTTLLRSQTIQFVLVLQYKSKYFIIGDWNRCSNLQSYAHGLISMTQHHQIKKIKQTKTGGCRIKSPTGNTLEAFFLSLIVFRTFCSALPTTLRAEHHCRAQCFSSEHWLQGVR